MLRLCDRRVSPVRAIPKRRIFAPYTMRSDFEFEDLFSTRQDRQSTLQRPPFEGKPVLVGGIDRFLVNDTR